MEQGALLSRVVLLLLTQFRGKDVTAVILGAGRRKGTPAEPHHLMTTRSTREGNPKGTEGHTLTVK